MKIVFEVENSCQNGCHFYFGYFGCPYNDFIICTNSNSSFASKLPYQVQLSVRHHVRQPRQASSVDTTDNTTIDAYWCEGRLLNCTLSDKEMVPNIQCR